MWPNDYAELSPAAAVDVVANATEAAVRALEYRIACLEAALVDAQRASARAIAGLLRDLEPEGKSAPAPAPSDKSPVETATNTVVEQVEDPEKSAETNDKGDKDKLADKPTRKRRHRFL
jgi:hypothetical protein